MESATVPARDGHPFQWSQDSLHSPWGLKASVVEARMTTQSIPLGSKYQNSRYLPNTSTAIPNIDKTLLDTLHLGILDPYNCRVALGSSPLGIRCFIHIWHLSHPKCQRRLLQPAISNRHCIASYGPSEQSFVASTSGVKLS